MSIVFITIVLGGVKQLVTNYVVMIEAGQEIAVMFGIAI